MCFEASLDGLDSAKTATYVAALIEAGLASASSAIAATLQRLAGTNRLAGGWSITRPSIWPPRWVSASPRTGTTKWRIRRG